MPFPTATHVNLPACSSLSSREAEDTDFKVIGLTRLGIKPKSAASKAYALTTRLSELFVKKNENVAK